MLRDVILTRTKSTINNQTVSLTTDFTRLVLRTILGGNQLGSFPAIEADVVVDFGEWLGEKLIKYFKFIS